MKRKQVFLGAGGVVAALAVGVGLHQAELPFNASNDLQQEGALAEVGAPPVETRGAPKLSALPAEVPPPTLTTSVFAEKVPPHQEARRALTPEPTQPITASFDSNIDLAAPAKDTVPNAACEVSLSAQPVAGASVSLSLDAPCLPNERVTFHHHGLMFTMVTDARGRVAAEAPALAARSAYIADFSTGAAATAVISVPDVGSYNRIALQWTGGQGFELHAREFGADYGDTGHIWHQAPGEPASVTQGASGFFLRLGDPSAPEARLLDIYTFPSLSVASAADVRLSVELPVVDENCGRVAEAQTLQVLAERGIAAREISVEMPSCEAVGDYVVLKQKLPELSAALD